MAYLTDSHCIQAGIPWTCDNSNISSASPSSAASAVPRWRWTWPSRPSAARCDCWRWSCARTCCNATAAAPCRPKRAWSCWSTRAASCIRWDARAMSWRACAAGWPAASRWACHPAWRGRWRCRWCAPSAGNCPRRTCRLPRPCPPTCRSRWPAAGWTSRCSTTPGPCRAWRSSPWPATSWCWCSAPLRAATRPHRSAWRRCRACPW